MRLVMVGLDYTTATMAVRELFSPDAAALDAALETMQRDGVAGAVLLSTCNRTELYLSHNADVPPDGVAILCRALGVNATTHRKFFAERFERQASEHLMRVAGGMASSVLGDDQIITQVRSALEIARKNGVVDAVLEALFRSAIAAGKKIKTNVSFAREGASVAGAAVTAADAKLDGLAGKRALVIGNGVIGKLAAAGLAAKGCVVAMTLRDPGRAAEMPEGCDCVDFSGRYQAMAGRDLVVSATSSPHQTVTADEVRRLASPPRLFVDLAMPRDIDPDLAELPETTLVNIDDMALPDTNDAEMRARLAAAEEIVMIEAERFDLWRRNRARRTGVNVSGTPDFPIFINLHGAVVLIAGGGRVAARRAEKLLSFGAKVRLASPALSPEAERLRDRPGFTWLPEEYRAAHLEGVTLAIAATDSREVNRRVGLDAGERGVLVSVADKRSECTFYFPAVVKSDLLTAGVVSNNGDHTMVKKAAAGLLREMEAMDERYQNRESRESVGARADAIGGGGDSA